MYCTPSDIIFPFVPIWPQSYTAASPGSVEKSQSLHGVDTLFKGWSNAQWEWVPAYIAYGLLENMAAEQFYPADQSGAHGTQAVKASLAPQAQEFHLEMLRKLAEHLAAEPSTPNDSLPARTEPCVQGGASFSSEKEAPPVSLAQGLSSQTNPPNSEFADPNKGGKKTMSGKGRSLGAHEQEFQQEMLRKLALHLAAQDREAEVETKEGVVSGAATPEVFPATPSSFGADHCEHHHIGGDDEESEETSLCWPSTFHGVWVPSHIAYGLLNCTARGQDNSGSKCAKPMKHAPNSLRPEDQEFHQQMLQKLALHLAAQPELSQMPSAPMANEVQAPFSKSNVSWADVTDDVEVQLPQGIREAEKPPVSDTGSRCRDVLHGRDSDVKRVCSASRPVRPDQDLFQQEMLRKLALHLAAQPESEKHSEEAVLETEREALCIGEDKARCDRLISELGGNASSARIAELMEWVPVRARALSLTAGGCRLVQKFIDVASARQRESLLDVFIQSDFTELYTSPHANHVIAKLVEILPAENLASIGEAMRGKAAAVARHQFGSRILERLLEHCGEDRIGFLMDELLVDIEPLARHQFANFVVARLLEHGTADRKHQCVQRLLPHVLQHATHKTACNTVQRMLEHSDLECQATIADAFLAGTGETSLESIAATRYGSFVIWHLVDRLHPRIDAVKARIKAAHVQLQASGFSQRKIVQYLGEAFFRD